MLKIYNIKDKMEYLQEVAELTQKEWGKHKDNDEFKVKVSKKIDKIKENIDKREYCKLILIEESEKDKSNTLIGFISIFLYDGDERKDLSPWYATMYIKREYRGKGYSKILNDAILNVAKKRKFKRIYLKTNLRNYYEKFGAKYIQDLSNGEKLYYFDL